MHGAGLKIDEAFETWLTKYTPVEQEIFAAREKRLAAVTRRRKDETRRFGDLCESTEGRAVNWRRKASPVDEQIAWANGDVFMLLCLARYRRKAVGRELDRLRHRIKRPLYYAAENARRRELAAARRKVTRRSTENPRPTREAILDAWTSRRSSHEAAIRFGGLIEDLECYLDNTLILDENGGITGRHGGVKRWLQTEIPALYLRYTTVMRYKAAAKKLRQITDVADPMPTDRIIDEPLPPDSETESIRRARAIWREVASGAGASVTALMDRLDAFLDPERVEEANLLAEWRERYKNEITLRTKSAARACGAKLLAALRSGSDPAVPS